MSGAALAPTQTFDIPHALDHSLPSWDLSDPHAGPAEDLATSQYELAAYISVVHVDLRTHTDE